MALLDVFHVAGSYNIDLDKALADAGSGELIVGRHQAVDITIDDDEMSRRHFELTLVKGQWAIEDLGSLNGTRVNGDVLVGRRVLHAGDEVHAGSTTMGYRDYAEADSSTGKKSPAPSITKGERAVLKELCRPYFSTGRTKAAASRECVAGALFTGVAAVQQHLGNLYDKFGIDGPRAEKRTLLAEKVIDDGVITRRDYLNEGDDTTSG